jgi:hypothetical protein
MHDYAVEEMRFLLHLLERKKIHVYVMEESVRDGGKVVNLYSVDCL